MPYLDRLQPAILLTSPSGAEFSAKWIGNDRTREKELGIFKTPGVRGLIIQDLDISADQWPMTIFFDGPDNDLEAQRFIDACAERNEWTVIHPVKGELKLQLVSVVEKIQPVTSGNVTEIPLDWLEVTDAEGAKSAAQLSAETVAQSAVLGQTTADQLTTVTELDTADKTGKFRVAVENVVSAYDITLKTITETVASVQAQADSIKRGIDATINEPVIDVLSVAGQLQALIETPNLVVTDLNAKIETYKRFSEKIFEGSPDAGTPAGINTAAIMELSLSTALGAVGVASVSTELTSRQNVIDNIESNLSLFRDVTNGLDDIQELYADDLLSESYFSQSQSFADAALLVGSTVGYLIKSVFDLAVEKKIIITEETVPDMLAMQEYGGPGIEDSNLFLFASSNNLTGQEIVLLPVGKVVVVYL